MLYDSFDIALYGGVLAWLAAWSAFGILLPVRASFSGSATTDVLASISAGVIISVALLHLLDDAQGRLKELTDYPAANAGCVVGFLVMAATAAFLPCVHGPSNREPLLLVGDTVDAGATLASFYALEISISLHSVLIGMSIGFAHAEWTELLILAAALSVHQWFEGFALGMLARRTRLGPKGWQITVVMFALSLPLGCLGAAALKVCFVGFEDSMAYLWVSGLLNAFASGMLLQIGVEMVQHELTGAHSHGCSDTPLQGKPRSASALAGTCTADSQDVQATVARRLLKMTSMFAGAVLFGVLAICA